MLLTDLLHFNEHGWCILSDILDGEDGLVYKFYTLRLFSNKPKFFFSPLKTAPISSSEKCDLRYSEIDDYRTLKRGDLVFYFVNRQKIIGGNRLAGFIEFGNITSINRDSGNIVIDNSLTIKAYSVLAYEHNFEQIQDSNASMCSYCNTLFAPYIKAKCV